MAPGSLKVSFLWVAAKGGVGWREVATVVKKVEKMKNFEVSGNGSKWSKVVL